ncbi:helix-turn-helix domain-containing protein [Rhodoligotrophos defluvii]|uniref:helix-turn-helix domain-containing protein n=1 Tax=Rhodoligotrophos defluvii TaxID=2561934 RepID=UPI0010C96A0A|nr:XRE family transcriptional regulator [Rhodoligotrophos defluvii]
MTDKRRSARKALETVKGPAEAVEDLDEVVVSRENDLELVIGLELRALRQKKGLSIADLAAMSGVSRAMLSRIENGNTSPSLGTMKSLAKALNVPIATFFRRYEDLQDATFVRAGEGLHVERKGSRFGHLYQVLGHSNNPRIIIEPYLITLTEDSFVHPALQHNGMEFIYLLEGEMTYRYASKSYRMRPGDSLFFDASALHGPDKLDQLPIRYISVVAYARELD